MGIDCRGHEPESIFPFPVVELRKVVERPEAACATEPMRSQVSLSRPKTNSKHMCSLDRSEGWKDAIMRDYVRLSA